MEQPRETAGATIRAIIEYVRASAGVDGVARLLQLAHESRPLSELDDERTWSSYDTKIALFEAASSITGQQDVARRIGESVLETRVGGSLKLALAVFGSPAQLVRSIAKANKKFSTAGEMEALEVTKSSAVIRYQIKPGYRLSRFDCDYAIGLLTHVSALFGLPPATVAHDECQVRGADQCIYRLTWRARASRLRRRGHSDEQYSFVMESIHQRLEDLQRTVSDLVSASDADQVLASIATRARSAVSAERFLLATRLGPDQPVRVHRDGFDEAEAQLLGEQLLETGTLGLPDVHVLTAPVATAAAQYGRIAAVGSAGFLDAEEQLLEAYARLAAVALQTVTERHQAEDRRRTAEVLFQLARKLTSAASHAEVHQQTVEALRRLCEAEACCLLVPDAAGKGLRIAARAGRPTEAGSRFEQWKFGAADLPGLTEVVATLTQPQVFDRPGAPALISDLMASFGTRALAVTTLRSASRVQGLLVALWFDESPARPDTALLTSRISAVADQATVALDRADLVALMQQQAAADSLTGLANRRTFIETLDEARQAHTSGARPIGLLFIDIDRFKAVNDSLGHSCGDQLLRAIGRRVAMCVRPDAVVARLGGDEFSVLLPDLDGGEHLSAVADQLLSAFRRPVDVDGSGVHVRLSIGGVLVRDDTATASELLSNADSAMYAAKKAGGNRFLPFDPALAGKESWQLGLETELQAAIDGGSLTVLYQPQVELSSGALVGAEALVRWDHPDRGRLLPEEFLRIADETGLIVPLDLEVIGRACRQGARWHRTGLDIRIAVNLSGRTLTDDRLLPALTRALDASGLPATSLELELTESGAVADSADVIDRLSAIRALGVSIAVDDLGTGYASLGWIRSFPIDRIKIDRSFVADLTERRPAATLVEGILTMARRLDCAVVAEGIETPAQVEQLLDLGCAEGQGYLFGGPVTGEAFRDVIRIAS